jgi:O-antigen/teichoic acid export membrane protein
MILDQFTLSFWGALRGGQNLKYESIGVVINQGIILVSGTIVLLLHLPLIFLMLPFVLASTFSLIFSGLSVRKMMDVKFRPDFDRSLMKLMVRISIPFALIAIFSRIYGYIDIVMLSKLAGDKATGWYSVAMKVPFALQFIPAALAAAIFPAFSHHFVHDRDQLKRTFERVMRFLIIIALPISFGIAILAGPIILSFYGPAYSPSIMPLQILVLALICVFLNFPLGSLLNGCDKQVTNTILVGATMVLNVILNIILIPRFQFIGASIAFVTCHTFLLIASLIVARRIVPYSREYLFTIFLRALFAASVMGIVIYYLINTLHFIILIGIGAVIYLVIIYLSGAIRRDDIAYSVNALFKEKEIPEVDLES